MRILLLNWRDRLNPLAGGAETHIAEVYGRLAARGWDVNAICARFPGAPERDTVDGIRTLRVGGPYAYPLALPRAYRALRAEAPFDVVVEFLNKLPLMGPCFVREPLALFAHHLFGSGAGQEVGALGAYGLQAVERLALRRYRDTPMLVGSASTRRELADLRRRDVGTIELLPYGVERPAGPRGARSETPHLLYLGRLKRYKGVEHVLHVVRMLQGNHPAIHATIAGEGEDRPRLEALARDLGLAGRVDFPGRVDEPGKWALFDSAWAMLFPSAKEGFGLTIPEAALAETPTVGFRVPGLVDAVDEGLTGTLVPYGDTRALARATADIIENAPLRARLGKAAWMRYVNASWEVSAEATAAVLTRIKAGNATESTAHRG